MKVNYGPIAQDTTEYHIAPANGRIISGRAKLNSASATASKAITVKYIDSSSSAQTVLTFTVPSSYAAGQTISGTRNSSSSHHNHLFSEGDIIQVITPASIGGSANTTVQVEFDEFAWKDNS